MSPSLRALSAGSAGLARSSDPSVAARQVAAARLAPAQEPTRRRLLDLIGGHPHAADRADRPGHLTASAVVVDPARRATLLMLHAKLGRWFQPGGHADGNTNLAGVALDEAAEETGVEGLVVLVPAIDVDVHRVAPPGEDAHLHFDLRHLVLSPPGAEERANHESRALRWVTTSDLEELRPPVDASTRRLVGRGLALAADLG